MKKILFVSLNTHVAWGGSEVLWSEAASRIPKSENVKVGFATKKWIETPGPIETLIQKGYSDLRWDEPSKKKGIVHKVFSKAFKFQKKDRFSTLLDDFEPTLVVISLGDHNSGWQLMQKLLDRKIDYVIIPQLVKGSSLPNTLNSRYEALKKGYQKAKMLCCVSYDNLKLLETQFATKFRAVEIVNNPIKAPEKAISYPTSENGVHIACVANFNVNHKGQDVILDVLREDKWQKRNIHIHFYGSGAHKRLLEDLIVMWEINNVTIENFATIDQIWEKNEMLILPSRMEGLSLALLEAFNFERTVLATNLGDASRFIENGVNGFLLEYPTKKLLDEKLEEAWNCRGRWKEMGVEAKETLLKKIEKDPVEKLVEIIMNLN